jgi:predicted phage tail protein
MRSNLVQSVVKGEQVNKVKREDLKKLLGESATDEVIDKIMTWNGADIELHKTKVTELQGQVDAANKQLTEANTAIEGFKKLNPEQLQKAADEWKTKYETAQTEAANQLAQIKFDHALDGALTGAKAKNPKAVKALLDMEILRKAYDEKTGAIVGFDEHLKPVKEANDYLFTSEKPTPEIVLGGNNQTVITDKFEAAMLRGAGLKPPESK